MSASAQLSVYPLRQQHLGPVVDAVRDVLLAHGLTPHVGPMSTLVSGEVDVLFRALGAAFAAATEAGEVVMTFTVSNACPVPNASA
jgi:uncharacterized protein YqgV (UPF0045/DUF77 family)